MSWGASFRVSGASIVDDTIVESNLTVDYHLDQYEEVLDAVLHLIYSGVYGDPEEFDFNVNLSGHGNEGHVPHPGWANDFVQITITQQEKA